MPVSSLDQFGHRFNFFMNGQTSTKTLTGFIFTLLAASLSVASFYIFYNAMVDRTTPTIQVSKVFVQDSQDIQMSKDLFFFVLVVNFGTLLPRNFIPLFGRVRVQLVYDEITNTPYPDFGNNTDTYLVTTYDLVACNETKGFQQNKQYLSKDIVTAVSVTGLCMPDLTEDQLKFWTLRSTTGIKYSQKKVSLQLLPCPLPTGCIPWIGKKDLMFYISTLERGYNGLDFNTPLVTLLNAENRFLPLEGMHKSIDLTYSRFVSNTDTGLLFSSIKEESGIRYEGISPYDYSPWGGTVNSPLITVNLVASLKQTTYLRQYGKITVLISNLGGIMQVTLSMIAIIYSIYNQYVRKRDLVVYGIMDMLPPEIEGIQASVKQSNKKLNKSFEELKSTSQREIASVKQQEGLSRQKTTILDTRLQMGSFWKYICFRGNQRTKRSTASLKSLQEFRRHEYWNDCERLLAQTTEVTVILNMMNELEILRSVFFTNYHERLAPRVGIHFLHQEKLDRLVYQFVSSEEVATLLKTKLHVESVDLSDEESSRSPQISSRNNLSIVMPHSLITVIKNSISKQVLQKYEDYKEREKTNFDIFSGIKEFLESAAFVGLQGLLNPGSPRNASKKGTQRHGSVMSRPTSQIEIGIGQQHFPKSEKTRSKILPSSMRVIRDDGMKSHGILVSKNRSREAVPAISIANPNPNEPHQDLETPPVAKITNPLNYGFPSNRMIKNSPVIVHNQKNGTNPNSQLVRVKVLSGATNNKPKAIRQGGSNALKPITAGTSSTQHIELAGREEEQVGLSGRVHQQDNLLQLRLRDLSPQDSVPQVRVSPQGKKAVSMKKPKQTGSLQWIPLNLQS